MRIAASSFLAYSAFAACVLAGHPAVADGPEASTAFTNASLQGRYAYVNNTGNVASLGPIVFNGRGGLSVQIVTNVPCQNPAPGCSRGINNVNASGTYSIRPNGTGVATINFGEPTGPITYDIVVVEADSRGASPLATEVFAAGRGGGLAGQLIAPTWTRIFDR
jgi:hypothetical protein